MKEFRKICNRADITELFKNIARAKEISVSVQSGNKQLNAVMTFEYKTGCSPVLRFSDNDYQPLPGNKVELSFFFKEIYFVFETNIKDSYQKAFHIEQPNSVIAQFIRKRSRYRVQNTDGVYVYFNSGELKYRVIDLSLNGISFENQAGLFSEGETIRNAVLEIGENITLSFDAAVRYMKQSRDTIKYGLNIISLEWSAYQILSAYISERLYPGLKSLTFFSKDDIAALYEHSKHTGIGNCSIQKNEFISAVGELEKIKNNQQLSINLVYRKNDRLIAVGSALRIYNRTFLAGETLVVPEFRLNPKMKADILIGLYDNISSHPLFDNLITYVQADFEWYQHVYEGVGAVINDNRIYETGYYKVHECDAENTDLTIDSGEYYTVPEEDPSGFLEFSRSKLSSLELACYGYDSSNFNPAEADKAFNKSGYSVKRQLFKITGGKNTSYAIADCITGFPECKGFQNTLRIHSAEDTQISGQLLGSVLSQASRFFLENGVKKYKVLYRKSVNEPTDISKKIFKSSPVIRVMMDRQGISEFYRLLSTNFEYYTRFYKLTLPQKAIWLSEKAYPGTSLRNIAGTMKLRGEFDRELIEKSLNIFVENNDALRLRLIEENGEVKQYVKDYSYFKVDFFDFTGSDAESRLYKWDDEQTQIPFNIVDSDLFYFAIVKTAPDRFGAYFKVHHLVSDAWTMSLGCTSVFKYYSLLKKGLPVPKEKKPSYIDFINDEEEYIYSERFLRNREFWAEKLEGFSQYTYIKPQARERHSIKAERATFVINKETTQRIYDYCKNNKISVFSLFMAIFSIFINRKTSQNDLVIGTPILNRSGVREKETAGLFVSTIPVRLNVDEKLDFKAYVQYITRELNLCFKNQKYNYELILKDFREKYKVNEQLYDCMFSYQNSKYEKDGNPEGFEARWHFNRNQIESLIIHLDDREDDGQLLLNIDYLTELFDKSEIYQLYDHLINLLENGMESQNKTLESMDMLTREERSRLVETVARFNNTKADYPKDKTIQELFEEQAERTPDNTALIFGDSRVTYRQLNEQANSLGRLLREKGVTRDSIVGITAYRSLEMITGIMAILKAGGAYLPIDPDYPEERIDYMLKNGNVGIVLVQEKTSGKINFEVEKINLNDENVYSRDTSNLTKINSPNDLAYVIYTSGSTGKPKGVMIEHHSVINRLNWMQKQYPIDQNDTLLQKTPFTFDVSVWELFWWSFNGAKLVILRPGGEKEPSAIADTIYKFHVTVIHFVPSMLSVFLDFAEVSENTERVKNLKKVFASGEALTTKHFERFYSIFEAGGINLINLYGPTEATVDVSYFNCNKEENIKVIPIGKPIDNIRLYILNDKLELQPIGINGELCIAGDGLARGYLNAPEITSQRFVEAPEISEGKVYKTGDLARWMSDGNIEYLGRIDSQVKIRGLRIELGEIEYQLLSLTTVREAVVIDRKDSKGNSYICAYYVSDSEIPVSEIRNYLAGRLPLYMVPSYFVRLEKLPLSPNGKADRKRLPEPYSFSIAEEEYIEPKSDLEKRIADIWKQALSRDKVSIRENFFNMGGDSLMAINVALGIGENVTISDIYSYPTIEAIAEHIKKKSLNDDVFYTVTKSKAADGTSFICIPYGGGVPVVYNQLGKELSGFSDKYSLYSVILPGHNFGNRQEEFKSIEETARICADEIKEHIKTDIVLYGHCVGSALTFEIARLLEKEGFKIKAVFTGGVIPPKFVRFYGNILDPWKLQSDNGVIKYLNKLGGFENLKATNEMNMVMKAFRHDVRCFMKYFSNFSRKNKNKLKAPLYCIIAENDLSTKDYNRKYNEWTNYANEVNLITLKGANHYFIKSHAKELAKIIDDVIQNIYKSGELNAL
ncbi:MAG: amino acid adenylation domain-containing protein [Bacillota bacterium]|nr:amino acid adenylation domain-containing protein [Bacillota bacterium]